nr:hypothetical protein [Tanacetum cinerariifolium]
AAILLDIEAWKIKDGCSRIITVDIAESLPTYNIYIAFNHCLVAFMSTYKLNDSIIWHARLGHVYFRRMQDMSKDGLIPAFDMDTEKWMQFLMRLVSQQPELELRKSKRNRTPKDFGTKFQLYLIKGTKDENVAFWKEAINDEMDSIMGNNTWVLADLPLGCKPLVCKWMFKRKLKVDPTKEFLSSRFSIKDMREVDVILGIRIKPESNGIAISQTHYIEKDDPKTFNEAMKSQNVAFWKKAINDEMDSIMGNNTWVLADLPSDSFHECDLDKEVYMNQPQGFIMPGNEKKVDPTKEFLSSRFSIKDMREVDVILGIRIKPKSNGIAISQTHYIEKVLKKFNYFDCTPASTSMDTSEKLMPNNGQVVS